MNLHKGPRAVKMTVNVNFKVLGTTFQLVLSSCLNKINTEQNVFACIIKCCRVEKWILYKISNELYFGAAQKMKMNKTLTV